MRDFRDAKAMAQALRDADVVPEDVLASPGFAFVRHQTRAGLLALERQLERRLKLYEDAQPLVANLLASAGSRPADDGRGADFRSSTE
jgi:hypothetical protein